MERGVEENTESLASHNVHNRTLSTRLHHLLLAISERGLQLGLTNHQIELNFKRLYEQFVHKPALVVPHQVP